jgi:phage terminase small subunit
MNRAFPRGQNGLNDQQEQFVLEYMKDYDAIGAYRRAGYEDKDDKVAITGAARLLKDARVMSLIHNERLRRLDRLRFDADGILMATYYMFLQAERAEDYRSAIQALEMLSKHFGVFEKHNWQKRKYTQEDVEKLKAELESKGFNFERVGLPSAN